MPTIKGKQLTILQSDKGCTKYEQSTVGMQSRETTTLEPDPVREASPSVRHLSWALKEEERV